MKKCGSFILVLALLIGARPFAGAAEPARKLPAGVAAHLSVKSPEVLLDTVERYAVTATRGSVREVPPGLIGLLAHIYVPIPFEVWRPDLPLNIVFSEAEREGALDMTVLFTAGDFDALMDGVGDAGWVVGGSDGFAEEGGGDDAKDSRRVRPVVLPNGRSMVFVDCGDGLVALAEDEARARIALGDGVWRPVHVGDADAALILGSAEVRNAVLSRLRSALVEMRERGGIALTEAGIRPDVAVGFLAATEKYAILAATELAILDNVLLELRIDEERALVDVGVSYPEGSAMAKIIAHAAGAAAAASPLENRVPDDAVSYSVGSSMHRMVPEAREWIPAANGDICGMILPELRERAEKISADFLAADMGPSVLGNYLRDDGRMHNVIIAETADAKALLSHFAACVDLANEILIRGAVDPGHGIRLDRETRGRDGVEYLAVRMVVDNPETRRVWDEMVEAMAREGTAPFKSLDDLRLYASARDGFLVIALGDLEGGEFVEIVKKADAPAAAPFVDRKAVKAVRSMLEGAQFTLGAVGADCIIDSMLLQIERRPDSGVSAEDMAELRESMAELSAADAAMGVAIGADPVWLRARFALPVETTSVFLRSYEAIEALEDDGTDDGESGGEPDGGDGDEFDREGDEDGTDGEAEEIEKIDAA